MVSAVDDPAAVERAFFLFWFLSHYCFRETVAATFCERNAPFFLWHSLTSLKNHGSLCNDKCSSGRNNPWKKFVTLGLFTETALVFQTFFYDNLHGVHTFILVLLPPFIWFWSRMGVGVKKVRLQVVFASSYPVRFKLCMVVYVDKKMRWCKTCFLWPWGVFKRVLMHFKMGGGGGGICFYSDWLN